MSPGKVLLQHQIHCQAAVHKTKSVMKSNQGAAARRISSWCSVVGKIEGHSWTDKNICDELFLQEPVLTDHGSGLTSARIEEAAQKGVRILCCSQIDAFSVDLPWLTSPRSHPYSKAFLVSWHNAPTKTSSPLSSCYLAVQVWQFGKEKLPQFW